MSDLRGLMNERTREDWWRDASAALAGVTHAVTGAVAANEYMAPRITRDLDIIVEPRHLHRAETALSEAGWKQMRTIRLDDGSVGRTWTRDGHEIDLAALRAPWARDAIRAAQTNVIDGRPVLPLAYIVLAKITSTRTIDLGDLSRMLGAAADEDLEEVRVVVRRYGRPQDIEDLEPLIVSGKLEWANQPPR